MWHCFLLCVAGIYISGYLHQGRLMNEESALRLKLFLPGYSCRYALTVWFTAAAGTICRAMWHCRWRCRICWRASSGRTQSSALAWRPCGGTPGCCRTRPPCSAPRRNRRLMRQRRRARMASGMSSGALGSGGCSADRAVRVRPGASCSRRLPGPASPLH